MEPSHASNSPDPRRTAISRRTRIGTTAVFLAAVLYLVLSRPSFVWRPPGTGDGRQPPKEDATSWHRYVRAPPSDVVHPVAVLEKHTTGLVRRPRGLVGGGKPTILVRKDEADEVPSIVVDFGMNTVGILSIEFAGAESDGDGLPGLRLAFSETLQHLSSTSDFSRSYNVRTQGHPIFPRRSLNLLIRLGEGPQTVSRQGRIRLRSEVKSTPGPTSWAARNPAKCARTACTASATFASP